MKHNQHEFISSIKENKKIKDPKLSVKQNGFDPRHARVGTPEEVTGTKEEQALKLCVTVYEDYPEDAIRWWSSNMQNIWKLGKEEANEK